MECITDYTNYILLPITGSYKPSMILNNCLDCNAVIHPDHVLSFILQLRSELSRHPKSHSS
jgi:hypothetical protein